MKLSEELTWRGFVAEHTFNDITDLDKGPRKFYLGVDPSADSMTIGNLAALMMCATFIRHGYEPTLLVGGATGQVGDPKMDKERPIKPIEEIEQNVKGITAQFKQIMNEDIRIVNNNDWFSGFGFYQFLQEVGQYFSMTQLLDRDFVKARTGEGGSGLSMAEFSYSLMQGYDFLHLFRTYGIDLQLCGADQIGNCMSGLHLISKSAGGEADVWSTPLVIDPVTGRKFGKSEGNAVWLSPAHTSVFDFYQFWLGQPDESVEYLAKIYTTLDKPALEDLLTRHATDPSKRLAQKSLAYEVTKTVHGAESADSVVKITTVLFGDADIASLGDTDLALLADFIPALNCGITPVEALVSSGLASSKSEARQLLSSGALSQNGTKITADTPITTPSLLKKGKNKFILIK